MFLVCHPKLPWIGDGLGDEKPQKAICFSGCQTYLGSCRPKTLRVWADDLTRVLGPSVFGGNKKKRLKTPR